MRYPIRFLAVLLFAIAALRADDSLAQARRAQMMLGSETWSQLIRVENRAAESRYPRVVHALVFELAGVLWFYTDTDGTQSFSLHRGRLAQEKADFAPLLRDIEPGFARWSIVSEANANLAVQRAADEPLRNGCFIESLAALRARLLTGAPTSNPRLLSYYVPTAARRQGHTVLAFDGAQGVEILDPAQPKLRFVVPQERGGDALALARAFDGADVARARELPLGKIARSVASL